MQAEFVDPLYISSSLITSHRTDQNANFGFDFQSYTSARDAKLETSQVDNNGPQNLELLDCANAERNAFGTDFILCNCFLALL